MGGKVGVVDWIANSPGGREYVSNSALVTHWSSEGQETNLLSNMVGSGVIGGVFVTNGKGFELL